MNIFIAKLSSWKNINLGFLLLRLAVGSSFIWRGFLKLFGPTEVVTKTIEFYGSVGLPAIMVTVVGVVEFVAGVLIVFGLFTRLVAVALALRLVAALCLGKIRMGFLGGYEFDMVLLAAVLLFALAGACKWSLDRVLCRKEAQTNVVQSA